MKASIPRIVLRTALGAAGCAYASLVLLPGSALASWLSRIPLVAQAIAFPSITAAGTVLAVAAALLGGLLARRGEGPRAGGEGRRAAAGEAGADRVRPRVLRAVRRPEPHPGRQPRLRDRECEGRELEFHVFDRRIRDRMERGRAGRP